MKIVYRILLLACLTVLFAVPAVDAQEKVKPQLAILPFTLNGAGDLAYLKEGIRTMLASRIDARAEIGKVVIGKGGSDPAAAAKTLAADLVLTGSITALGSSVSIDVQLLTVATDDSASFFAVAANQSGVIGAVDQLASDIIARISGEARQARSVDQVAVSAPVPVRVPSPPLAVAATGSSLNATRSQFLAMEVQVMDVGDVFGDGDEVLVLAEKHKISFYRQEGNRLVDAGGITDGPKYARVVALNLADLNGNGRAEVYVSASSGNGPSSYAVEWNGKTFVRLFDRQRWYIRPIVLPGQGLILAGQLAGNEGPVNPAIYKLAQKDGKLQRGEKLAVPEEVNLYDFVMGDFTGDGQVEIAVQTQQRELLLYTRQGDVLWRGSGKYGFTRRFIGEASGVASDQPANFQVLTRLVARDLDRDGRPELVVMKNPDGLSASLKTIGSFTGGSIDVMHWNGVTFEEQWSSGEIGSYLATFQVNDAGSRLYLGLVSKKSGTLFKALRSAVASYGLADIGGQR
jgi:TolB-like protein